MTGLDLSTVVRARLELEGRRIDAVERLRTEGPSAAMVDRLTGGRLATIVANERKRFAQQKPERPDFARLAALGRSTDNVSREGMSLAMGALARDAGLDDGSCAQADRFVRWLAGKGDLRAARMSVPGDAHAVHRSTDVIRRQVPDHGLWDLPILAHEFGHLAAGGLSAWDAESDTVSTPVTDELAPLDGPVRSQETELFCDLFATYALGPSFLCTLVFHRANPAAEAETAAQSSHPSDPVRVFAVRRLLQQLRGNTDEVHGFDTQLYWADRAWAQMQAGGPPESMLTDEQAARTLTRVARWWSVLSTQLAGFAYVWSPAIEGLTTHLRRPGEPVPLDGYSAADVLNAAWDTRLRDWFAGKPTEGDYEQRTAALLDLALPSEVTDE